MELIIKICDSPPPLISTKKRKITDQLWYIIFFMENWSLVVSDLYRAHAERVGGRFTYNQLKWNVCKKMFLKESYYYSSSWNKTKICT